MKIIKDLYFSIKEVISRLICIKKDWENVINHRSRLANFFVQKIVIIFLSILVTVHNNSSDIDNEVIVILWLMIQVIFC